jgi:hypothetical protein
VRPLLVPPLAVLPLVVTPLPRLRPLRRRPRVRYTTYDICKLETDKFAAEKEESDDDMGFGLFD